MCTFYIIPLIYTKIPLFIASSSVFFNGFSLVVVMLFIFFQFGPFRLNLHKFFSHGTAKEIYRNLLVVVFHISSGICTGYCHTFFIPDPDSSLRLYFLRQGDGYHVTSFLKNSRECHLSPGGILFYPDKSRASYAPVLSLSICPQRL